MAIRNLKTDNIDRWVGIDTFNAPESLTPAQLSDMLNCVIGPNGDIIPLRSPANFNDAVGAGSIVSAAFFDTGTGAVLFDVDTGSDIVTYSTTGSTNTSRRTTQTARFQSANVKDKLFRVNGAEFVQFLSTFAAYPVGIAAPAAAPTASIVAGGSGTLSVGVTVSYAYRNSNTGHIGNASPVSGSSGATSGGDTLRVAVTASAQSGVNGIVLFISEDAGSVRYLQIDSNGDPVVHSNATGNIDISVATILRNDLIQETTLNSPPPAGLTYIAKWKSRLVAPLGRNLRYSANNLIDLGIPYECWPELNSIPSEGQSETLNSCTPTDAGLFALSDRDSSLVTGSLSDKEPAGENPIQFTENMRCMNWGIGTRSPLSLKNTPFGPVWLDQDLKLRLWTLSGPPMEIAEGLRDRLDSLQKSDTMLARAQGAWFNAGKDGGFYVLTGSTTGSTNDIVFIVTIFRISGNIWIAAGVSDLAAECIEVAKISSNWRCLVGAGTRLRRFLEFDTAGAGWDADTEIYVEMITGNDMGRYSTLHSMVVDGAELDHVIAEVRDIEDTDIEGIELEREESSWKGSINRYGVRHKLRFNFPITDEVRREIRKLGIAYAGTRRQL